MYYHYYYYFLGLDSQSENRNNKISSDCHYFWSIWKVASVENSNLRFYRLHRPNIIELS